MALKYSKKALLLTVAALFAWWHWHVPDIARADGPPELWEMEAAKADQPVMSVDRLRAQYASNNSEFFNDRLPKDVVIDYSESDGENMATTMKFSDGTFHIALNPEYAGAKRVAEYLLLHEACHVAVWDRLHKDNNQVLSWQEEHGPVWRACMLKIDAVGGFRQIFIDSYVEKIP